MALHDTISIVSLMLPITLQCTLLHTPTCILFARFLGYTLTCSHIPLTHSTHSLTHHSLTPLHTHSLTHSHTHSLTLYLLTHSPTLTHSTHTLTHSLSTGAVGNQIQVRNTLFLGNRGYTGQRSYYATIFLISSMKPLRSKFHHHEITNW